MRHKKRRCLMDRSTDRITRSIRRAVEVCRLEGVDIDSPMAAEVLRMVYTVTGRAGRVKSDEQARIEGGSRKHCASLSPAWSDAFMDAVSGRDGFTMEDVCRDIGVEASRRDKMGLGFLLSEDGFARVRSQAGGVRTYRWTKR